MFLDFFPFLIYHLVKYGDPLEALTPQTSFAVNGLALGEYSFEQWWMMYNIAGNCTTKFVSVLIIGTPFVIIHG